MADKTPKVARALTKAARKIARDYTAYLLNHAGELDAGYVPAEIGESLDGRMAAGWTPLNRIGEPALKIRMAENGDLTRDRIVHAAAIALVKPGETEGLIYDIVQKTASQIPIDREWLLELALTSQTFTPATGATYGVTDGYTDFVTV